MLQSIREKTASKIAYIGLSLLLFVFMFFGVQGYVVESNDQSVAKVGRSSVSAQDYRDRLNDMMNRMRSMMGESFRADFFNTPEYKRQLVDQLIDEELLTQVGAGAGVAISDARLREEIRKMEVFQVEGKFDASQYQAVLAANRMAPSDFQERMRRDLAVRELPSQIGATAAATEADAREFIRLRDQTRSFRYLKLEPQVITPDSITDEAAKTYFSKNGTKFETPEQVSLEYVELNSAALNINPPEESLLQTRYEEQKAQRFGSGEQRLVSHLLVDVPANADAEAQKAALARAEAIAARIKAGEAFADVARAESADPGSKDAGGDLGWIEKGGGFEAAFEDAVFSADLGSPSSPVLTAQGYHLILVREVRAASFKPFEEVRTELENEYLTQQREQQFSTQFNALVEAAYQNPGSLEPAAKAIEASVQKTESFDRDSGAGIALYPAVREAAFADEVLIDRANSEAVEIGPNHIVFLRVLDHKPRAPRKLEEVMAEVKAAVAAEDQTTKAKSAADAFFARLSKGEGLDVIATETGAAVAVAEATGRNAMTHDNKLVTEVFKLARPADGKPKLALMETSDQKHALVELTAVNDPDPSTIDEAALKAARDSLKSGLAASDNQSVRDSLRKRVDITVYEDRL